MLYHLKKFLLPYVVYICAYAVAHVHMWKSEDNFVELLFSFILYVSSGMGIRSSGLICEFLKSELYII